MNARRGFAATGLAAAGLLAVAGCGSSSSGGSATAGSSASPPAAGSSAAAPVVSGCTPSPPLQSQPQRYSSAPPVTTAATTYTATIKTNCGTIVVALDGRHAPHTVSSFAFLAGKGYFTDTPCHRLVTAGIYVLQCGDPTGTGQGGPGYTIPDENLKGATYPAGTVAMANTGQPHTGGSQFFLVYKTSSGLTPSYTPFGRVTSGLGILAQIAAAGSDNANGPDDGAPRQPVTIESFTVTKGSPA